MAIENSFIPGSSGGGGGLAFTNGWTLDKLLKGAGVGSDPTEIANFLAFAYGWTSGKLLKGTGVGSSPVEISEFLAFAYGWTANKILKGGGVGSNPTELDAYRTFATGWTANKILKGGGALADPVEFSGWQVVTEIVVPADCSYVDINSLDVNTDKFYIILANLKNATATGYSVVLYANGDYADSHYHAQVIDSAGTTLIAGNYNAPYIGGFPASGCLMAMAYINRDILGNFRYYTFTHRYLGASTAIQNWAGNKNDATIANLTSLRLLSGTNSIAAGSVIMVCKPRTA
jgi:hypothetical protein